MKNKKVSASTRPAAALSGQADTAGFDWNDLKYFLAVAREGGLSKAGLALGTSASTVSRHVSALEQRLGVRLFVRLSTGYLLTDAGSGLFERVAEVERSTHAVARGSSIAAEQEKVTGLIRLATADSIGTFLLAPRMGLLRKQHPCLRVELSLGYVQVDLTRREADMALRVLDAGGAAAAHPDHVLHRIGTVRLSLYMARQLLGGTAPQQVDWRALDHIGWDVAWRHLALSRWMDEAFQRPPAFSSNSLSAHLELIKAGMGVGVLPDYMAKDNAALVRLPGGMPPARDLWLVYHRDLRDSRRVQALRRFIEEVLPPALAE